jgi:hypothetical protein
VFILSYGYFDGFIVVPAIMYQVIDQFHDFQVLSAILYLKYVLD